jgi:nucleoside 2-deoxyribosyltransferase
MRHPLKIVYVAGPITAPTPEEVAGNVEVARRAAKEIWRMGAYALVPHLNSPMGLFDGEVTNEEIYLADLEMLERCDAVFLLPNWENSRGANYERAWAEYHTMPIFESLAALEKWLRS